MLLYSSRENGPSSHRDMTPLQIRFIRSSWLLVEMQTGILHEAPELNAMKNDACNRNEVLYEENTT